MARASALLAMVAVLAAAAVPLQPAAASANLVVNGGFEVKSSQTALLPDGWSEVRPGTAHQSPAQASEGSRSLGFIGQSSANHLGVRSARLPISGCEVAVGFTIDVYRGAVMTRFGFYDAAGNEIDAFAHTQEPTSGWVRTREFVVLPAGTEWFDVTFGAGGIGAVVAFVDDVQAIAQSCQAHFFDSIEQPVDASWVYEGASVTCFTEASDGSCSILLAPPCCAFPDARRMWRPLDLALGAQQTFVFDFYPGDAFGFDRISVILHGDAGDVAIHLGEDRFPVRSGLSVRVDSGGQRSSGVEWPTPDRWYRAYVHLDTVNDVVEVEVRYVTGALVGSTSPVPFSSGSLERVTAQIVRAPGEPGQSTYYVDRLQLL